MKEYLATLDDAAFGAASDVTPKFVSPSDPAAQWTGAMRGPAFFAYADNYLIDVKFGIIMDVEATRAIRQAEVGAAKKMIERTEECFDIKPERLAADTAYGSAAMLDWIVNEKGIAPHIPVWDRSKREDGTFSREDFTFDKEHNIYICPAFKILITTGKIMNGEMLAYRASKADCDACPFKTRCCPKEPSRKILRSLHEEARDVARALAKTEAFQQSCRERKRVEMLFAHLKRILRLGRLTIARTAWSPVRVHTGSHRPEPAPPCKAGGTTAARGRRVRCVSVSCVEVAWRALVPGRRAAAPAGASGNNGPLPHSPRGSCQFLRRLLQQNRHTFAGPWTAIFRQAAPPQQSARAAPSSAWCGGRQAADLSAAPLAGRRWRRRCR